ncbi:alkylphosphonate utilization protein [Pedobacter sp. SYSU D00535]|uniref:PhnA domain-containing protein n=1 Tax=Pedobacter sp. SYSU D00535 TaxID=2810308 RepID=UPI001A97570A|nr:alkylphosphonate utilization protein [Pedobacter sp. SYSU D00535]
MALHTQLQERSNNTCELCGNQGNLSAYAVPPKTDDRIEDQVVLCSTCFTQIQAADYSDVHHWRCLEGSIWSEVPAVKVLSYKLLSNLSNEEWARDAMEAAALDESFLTWANAEKELEAGKVIHKDSYGVVLASGDTVVLTQNLNVKGTNYIAPKGTIVRKIKLVADNAEQVEGKINGDTIVILTKFIRKSV